MKELSHSKVTEVPGGGEPARSGVERSGTERSDGSPPPARHDHAPLTPIATPTTPPDPEVLERPKSRRFSAEYKQRILQQADRCDQPGQIGALLRREGLYSSLLSRWRRQRDAGALGALGGQKRGPRVAPPNPLASQVAQQQREINRLEKKLKRAEAIITFQKKIAAMLDIPMSPFDDEEND